MTSRSHPRTALAALAAGAVLAVTAMSGPAAAAADKAPGGVSRAAGLAELRGVAGNGRTSVVAADPAARSARLTATFNVTYTGFTSQARAAFQRAVNVWATKVSSSVPITVSASFEPLGSGILGSAGPSSVWRDFAGAPQAGTWYVDAIANKHAGSQLSSSPDIVARFSSNFSNWYFGTGSAPSGTYDFTSVVLHELGHGLGFLGAGTVSGTKGTVRLSGFPIAYDRFTETKAGKATLAFADNSVALGKALKGNKLYFDSPAVRGANGNKAAKLYAPAAFQPGSSYSHLDEATYPKGNANSLMTPQLADGETIRQPGAITLAVFSSIGW